METARLKVENRWFGVQVDDCDMWHSRQLNVRVFMSSYTFTAYGRNSLFGVAVSVNMMIFGRAASQVTAVNTLHCFW